MDKVVDEELLDRLEELTRAATPAPWPARVWQGDDNTTGVAAVGPHHECACAEDECDPSECADELEDKAYDDARFIEAMREYAHPLIQALRCAWELQKCECGADEACAFARDRDRAQAALQSAQELNAKNVNNLCLDIQSKREVIETLVRERDTAWAEIDRLRRALHDIAEKRDGWESVDIALAALKGEPR